MWPNTHPFPSRTDLMSLSTINAEDAPTRLKIFKHRGMTSLKTEDIEGAKPLLRGYQHMNKPEFSNNTSDIEKACPKKLHQLMNKPSFSLLTSDIDKARPRQGEFHTNRVTNPLNPQYKLASFEVRAVTPPKFVRDSMPVNDIKGTQPELYHKWATRDCISVKDIEGAKAKPEKILAKPDLMNPKDINGSQFQTRRVTNPLEPEYVGRDLEGKVVTIGHIEGSKSKPDIRISQKPHRRNFDTSDIEGCRPNTVGLGAFVNKERTTVKKTVDASDIEGSNPGSHKKGIVTKRVTNPLQPVYEWTTEELVTEAKPLKFVQSESKKTLDPEIASNNARFFGVNPAGSRNQSLPSSRPATSKPKDMAFQKSVHHFFDQPLPTEELQEAFKKNSEKFFGNPQARLEDRFMCVNNPKTIHRVRKEVKAIDPVQMGMNIKGFCGVSSENSRPVSSGSSYKFTLSRSEIAKPTLIS